jgi:beta-aspartyl-peptidase (threonine type)
MTLRTAFICFSCLAFFLSCTDEETAATTPEASQADWAIVIHGGAGNFDTETYSGEQENAYLASLETAIGLGEDVLRNGGTSLDAVETTIRFMENDSLFNAGKGAVFTSEGVNEMDASIMQGKDLNCGAVTGIQNIKNPISAARAVMENSNHVFFSGAGARAFAADQGLEEVDSSYFKTEKSWSRYLRAKDKHASLPEEFKYGTVGCVALDKEGNIVAGTSTGGMTWKKHGRIGDSPVIAAGTYADNNSGGISCTGHGEYFIRAAVAHDIVARMEYKDISLQQAAEEVVMKKLVDMGGSGGIVGLDRYGNEAMVFNSTGMFRAYSNSEGEKHVAMYREN